MDKDPKQQKRLMDCLKARDLDQLDEVMKLFHKVGEDQGTVAKKNKAISAIMQKIDSLGISIEEAIKVVESIQRRKD